MLTPQLSLSLSLSQSPIGDGVKHFFICEFFSSPHGGVMFNFNPVSFFYDTVCFCLELDHRGGSAGIVSVAHTSAWTIRSYGQPSCSIAPRQASESLPYDRERICWVMKITSFRNLRPYIAQTQKICYNKSSRSPALKPPPDIKEVLHRSGIIYEGGVVDALCFE